MHLFQVGLGRSALCALTLLAASDTISSPHRVARQKGG
jgi:hypothetical protein